MSLPKNVQPLIFRITVIWHSVLSWMHWRQRARERRLQEQAQMREQFRAMLRLQEQRLQEQNRQLLLEALRPVALAMQRQDSLHQQQHQQLESLLLEVLNSLQPSAAQQIFQRIGLPPPRNFSRSLVS